MAKPAFESRTSIPGTCILHCGFDSVERWRTLWQDTLPAPLLPQGSACWMDGHFASSLVPCLFPRHCLSVPFNMHLQQTLQGQDYVHFPICEVWETLQEWMRYMQYYASHFSVRPFSVLSGAGKAWVGERNRYFNKVLFPVLVLMSLAPPPSNPWLC